MDELSQNGISLRAELNGPLAEQYQKIKSHYGMSKNTELLRFLIKKEYNHLFQNFNKPVEPLEVPPIE